MSQQQPPDPMVPPPAMTGFTVTDGFSVIPPKRPVAVTAASWVMFAVAGLSLIGAFALLINDLLHLTSIFELISHQGFWNGLLLFIVAAATAVFAMLVRNASTGAQIATSALLGAMAVYFLATAIGDIARVPFLSAADSQGPVLLLALIFLGVAALAATPVVLLASPAAARWFRRRRQEVTFIDAPAAPTRPAGFTVAIAFTGLTGLLEIVNIVVYSGWVWIENVDFVGSDAILAAYYLGVGIPVLLAVAVTAGLAVGNDLSRVAAYGVCGYYCYNALSAVFGFMFIGGLTIGVSWIYYLNLILTVFAAITAAVALFGLSQKPLLQWFDAKQEPPQQPFAPTAPPPAAPTGQE